MQYTYDCNTGAQQAGYDKKTVTPALGLVVKPSRMVSLYANYIEALVQGDVAPLISGGADELITVRGTVENVTDKDYWASVGGEPGANYLVLAAPRTIKVSLSVDL